MPFALAACGRINFTPLGGDILGDGQVPEGTNIAFVTSTGYAGDMIGGLAGADAICAQHATAGGLPGRYVAWLSDATTTAASRIGTASGWVRLDGRIVATSRAALLNASLLHPIWLDEVGGLHSAFIVTTGSDVGGVYDTIGDCNGYSTTNGLVASGVTSATGRAFTRNLFGDCATPQRLYCLGVDFARDLTPTPVVGRYAFLSIRPCDAGTGRASCDAVCQTDASGLPGTYLSALALTTESVASRFDATGLPWVRVDGIQLAPTAAAFLTTRPPLTTALYRDGRVSDTSAWSGVPQGQTFEALATFNCNDWSSRQNGVYGDIIVTGLANGIPSFGQTSCANALQTLCLQE